MSEKKQNIIFGIILFAIVIGFVIYFSLSYNGIDGEIKITSEGKNIDMNEIGIKCSNDKIESKKVSSSSIKFFVKNCKQGSYDFIITVPGSELKIDKFKNREFIHKVGYFCASDGMRSKLKIYINYINKNNKWYADTKVVLTDNESSGKEKDEILFLIKKNSELGKVGVGL